MIACATVFGKIPYYEGINIKSATPTRLFTSVVIPINSWRITKENPFLAKMPYYELSYHGSLVTTTQQYLIFHGAKNTEYNLYFVSDPNFIDGSVGIPSDYRYFYGISMYDPISTGLGSAERAYLSSYFKINGFPLANRDFFNNKVIKFTTNNNGDYTFMLTTCTTSSHILSFTAYFYLKDYEQHKLIYSHSVHNIFD